MQGGHSLDCKIEQLQPIRLKAEFSCLAGEVLAVVGPSGGGKTTLLRMIAGLTKPENGVINCGNEIWFDKTQSISLSSQQRHLGYVPQHFGLFPHLTALENVISGLDHLPKAFRIPQALDWLEKVNLKGMPDRLPSQLSGGQKQRVALARALAREPKVLLLDEPFSAVDRETRERLYLELAKLKSQLLIPVIMVTHDLNEALLLADKMLLISHGEMLQQGNPFEVLTKPRNAIVARQMGLKNLFSGEIVAHDEIGKLTWLKVGEQLITCNYDSRWELGQQAQWVIPNQGIRFNSIKKGRLCKSFNKLELQIDAITVMGEQVRLQAKIQSINEVLKVEVPLNLVKRLKLSIGNHVSVALKSEQIHLLEP